MGITNTNEIILDVSLRRVVSFKSDDITISMLDRFAQNLRTTRSRILNALAKATAQIAHSQAYRTREIWVIGVDEEGNEKIVRIKTF